MNTPTKTPLRTPRRGRSKTNRATSDHDQVPPSHNQVSGVSENLNTMQETERNSVTQSLNEQRVDSNENVNMMEILGGKLDKLIEGITTMKELLVAPDKQKHNTSDDEGSLSDTSIRTASSSNINIGTKDLKLIKQILPKFTQTNLKEPQDRRLVK